MCNGRENLLIYLLDFSQKKKYIREKEMRQKKKKYATRRFN